MNVHLYFHLVLLEILAFLSCCNCVNYSMLPSLALPKVPVYRIGSPFFPIAGFFPLSSGYFALPLFPGIQNALAFKYAISLINSDSSILPNVTLVYDIRNVGFTIDDCLSSAISVLESEITMIIGILMF